jgi:hypothetical protein
MLTAMRRRSSWAVAASVLAHLGVLVAVLLQHPTLVIPAEPSGPPEAIIPVLILPRTPPAAAHGGARPAPIHLHQRTLRNLPAETPVAPVVLPTPKPVEPPPQAAPSPALAKAAQAPPPPPDAIRATLRTALGCNSPSLSRDERARCQEQFGRSAHDDPFLAAPISGEKRAAYDAAGAAKLAARSVLDHPIPPPGPPLPADYDGEPVVGSPMEQLYGPMAHKASKRAARVLKRLPP